MWQRDFLPQTLWVLLLMSYIPCSARTTGMDWKILFGFHFPNWKLMSNSKVYYIHLLDHLQQTLACWRRLLLWHTSVHTRDFIAETQLKRLWKIMAVKPEQESKLSENISKECCYAQTVREKASGPQTAHQDVRMSVGTSAYSFMHGWYTCYYFPLTRKQQKNNRTLIPTRSKLSNNLIFQETGISTFMAEVKTETPIFNDGFEDKVKKNR